jgi:hypothetical protein
VSAVAWVVLAVFTALVGAEVIAWCPPLQRLILRRTAAGLPQAHRDRYLEEWQAELEALPNGPVTRLWFAMSLFLQRGKLVRELAALTPARSPGASISMEAAGVAGDGWYLLGVPISPPDFLRLDHAERIAWLRSLPGSKGTQAEYERDARMISKIFWSDAGYEYDYED